MFDKTLAAKFHAHINGMSNEEIQRRAENARSSGMEAIINEWDRPTMIIGTAIKIGELMVTAFDAPHDECIAMAGRMFIDDIDMHLQKYENYGFYDNKGKFYTRDAAAEHAFKTGQLDHPNGTTSAHYGW